MRKLVVACASVLLLSSAVITVAQAKVDKLPAYIFTALGDKDRPADDVKLDEARKPAEIIAFAGIKPGSKVDELLPGGGYFTHIIADVVGPTGHVFAVVTSDKGVARVAAVTTAHANVTAVISPLAAPALPGDVDVVWTTQNYHDLHNPPLAPDTTAKVNAAAFAALKPGGVYLVLDHAAAAGSGLRDTGTLHRIDPAIVKKEVEAAGFKFDGETRVLHNPADDHTLKVNDDKIRHHTDQFAFRFRKPKH
jgi:predicted methyltransferase